MSNSEIPLDLFTAVPEYRNQHWLDTVPRELCDSSLKKWELFHPIQIAKVRGWENVATRVWANVVALEANYNEPLAQLILAQGSIPEDANAFCRMGEFFIDSYRGIAFFAAMSNVENYLRACWLVTTNAVLIEEVGAKRMGKSGSWGLTKALLNKLKPYAKDANKPIHVSAITPESEQLFLHYGFSKFTPRVTVPAITFRSDLILRLS